MPWLIRTNEPGEPPRWRQRTGPDAFRTTNSKWAATRYTNKEKNEIGDFVSPEDEYCWWEFLNTKTEVTLDDLRERIMDRPMWIHAITVIDVIEYYVEDDLIYAMDVNKWLTDPAFSTVWFRDFVMEPIRLDPVIVEIGKRFNPTTEWDNTWMPLDTAIHCVRNGMKIGE